MASDLTDPAWYRHTNRLEYKLTVLCKTHGYV